ncbi:MAG: site-specific integrase [Micrococcales bacterium]|nr:site-specific integrase [Micrococcales bacterium]
MTKTFQHCLTDFLVCYLPGQVGAATNTITSYRDTFTLLLRYCQAQEHVSADKMSLDLLDRPLVERFCAWLEHDRGCSAATRNQRLAAIRSFCRFLQTQDVAHIGQYQQVLAIPKKRAPQPTVTHLSLEAVKTVLAQPDTTTPAGRRDLALLTLTYDTGARVQEVADLTVADFRPDPPATLKLTGKGHKTRIVPLMTPTADLVHRYTTAAEMTGPADQSRPLFPGRGGKPMTRAGITYILDKHVRAARTANPTVLPDKVTPHSLRHSKAMHLLQAGVNLVYIRDILGHADLKTTEIYARTDSQQKRLALEAAFTNTTATPDTPLWHHDQDLLTWLTRLGR